MYEDQPILLVLQKELSILILNFTKLREKVKCVGEKYLEIFIFYVMFLEDKNKNV
jgi:hypothetical protein